MWRTYVVVQITHNTLFKRKYLPVVVVIAPSTLISSIVPCRVPIFSPLTQNVSLDNTFLIIYPDRNHLLICYTLALNDMLNPDRDF